MNQAQEINQKIANILGAVKTELHGNMSNMVTFTWPDGHISNRNWAEHIQDAMDLFEQMNNSEPFFLQKVSGSWQCRKLFDVNWGRMAETHCMAICLAYIQWLEYSI